jgi:hypothetical protein
MKTLDYVGAERGTRDGFPVLFCAYTDVTSSRQANMVDLIGVQWLFIVIIDRLFSVRGADNTGFGVFVMASGTGKQDKMTAADL